MTETSGHSVPVLLIVQELCQGGSERQLTEIARSLDRNRFTVHVATMRPGGIREAELREAGIPVACFRVTSFASPTLLTASIGFARYLRQHNIQICHSFDTPGNVFAVPAARAARVPVVLSSQRAFRSLAPGPFRHLLRLTDHLVQGVVVNCSLLIDHLSNEESVDSRKIHLCHNGVDTDLFKPPATRDSHQVTIGVVCALRPEKGLDTLVRAFATTAKSNADVRLTIVGSGPVLPSLQTLASELGIKDRVHFEPSTKDVPSWLHKIDIFVLPSLSEAFSNSLLEAMSSGCAVLASNVGGNPELIGNRDLLFSPGDHVQLAAKLQTLTSSPELRHQLSAAARQRAVEHFSLPASTRRMTAIYDSYLNH